MGGSRGQCCPAPCTGVGDAKPRASAAGQPRVCATAPQRRTGWIGPGLYHLRPFYTDHLTLFLRAMCGIFFSLSRHAHVTPDDFTEGFLGNRGPDSTGKHQIAITAPGCAPRYATFISTVLSLRGSTIVTQPLQDPASGSVLCWNGEAWSIQGSAINGNDSQRVFDALLEAIVNSSQNRRNDSIKAVVAILSTLRGPYALVFYDANNGYLYYGRDCLGRRSLLQTTTNNAFTLSSVADYTQQSGGDAYVEVEADGLYFIDLQAEQITPTLIPQHPKGFVETPDLHFVRRSPQLETMTDKLKPISFPSINRELPSTGLHPDLDQLKALEASLKKSLECRVQHVREAVQLSPSSLESHTRIAILFSGGLDCTILARLCHDLLPADQSIDLLNVAFENPRIHKNLDPGISPYSLCPDRITGQSSYAELKQTCPGRHWRLVEINVPYTETLAHRSKLLKLIHPHITEMDLSIAYALYFASRGKGIVTDNTGTSADYTTPAHVLLSGLGADELFGGYQRHTLAHSRGGYPSLIAELALDFERLGKRNLGRDDRVISDSSREVRFPYLDEEFIALVLGLPVWAKCDFANAQDESSDDPRIFLEPGKRALRMLAWRLGMQGVAREKKRAIQFGARTAKVLMFFLLRSLDLLTHNSHHMQMETGRSKGTHVVS